MPEKLRKLLAARMAPRDSFGLRSCKKAINGMSYKPAVQPKANSPTQVQ